MGNRRTSRAWASAASGVLLLAGGALAQPILEIAPVAGPGITVAVRLRNISATPVAGWQAFLEFDPARLSFVSGTYVTTNFGLPLVSPIAAQSNHIDLAAGINPFLSQNPTNVDQDIAILTFNTVGTGCLPQVRVRTHTPPTRLTDSGGLSIDPLTLISPWTTCNADINRSGSLNVTDIFDFLFYWFASDCRADFNGVGGINVTDIFDFLTAWFAGCP